MTLAGSQRRADYAELTRQAIIDAARTLFAQHGYFATRVDQIAELARVAPKTVYGVVGGKQGLLGILVERWLDAPVVGDGLDRMKDLPDSLAVLGLLSGSVRSICEEHGDVVQVLLAAAPHDPVAAEGLRRTGTRIRESLGLIAQHIADRGELAEGMDLPRAVDVLYFYFGPKAYFILVQDEGWSPADAERWLLQQCAAALLR